eukprot:scaffold84015_cov63-Phaeocystis_antarctica.AAC.1
MGVVVGAVVRAVATGRVQCVCCVGAAMPLPAGCVRAAGRRRRWRGLRVAVEVPSASAQPAQARGAGEARGACTGGRPGRAPLPARAARRGAARHGKKRRAAPCAARCAARYRPPRRTPRPPTGPRPRPPHRHLRHLRRRWQPQRRAEALRAGRRRA